MKQLDHAITEQFEILETLLGDPNIRIIDTIDTETHDHLIVLKAGCSRAAAANTAAQCDYLMSNAGVVTTMGLEFDSADSAPAVREACAEKIKINSI